VAAYRKAADAVQRGQQPLRQMFDRDGRDGHERALRP
jgi:hypothetical protein